MDAQIYAPDYLRAQDDKQLHMIADMIEQQIEKIRTLEQLNHRSKLESLIGGHIEAMRPLLDEWSKSAPPPAKPEGET